MAKRSKRMFEIKRKQLNNKGLTLVEVMVSVTMFAIMIYPILTQMNSLLKQNYTSKLNQAETDFASRVMEEFKDAESGATDLPKNSSITKAGYSVKSSDPTDPDAPLIYYKNNIVLEKDIDTSDPSIKTMLKNGDTYRVEVSLDSSAYDTTNGTNAAGSPGDEDKFTYKNPNDTKNFDLQNIDDRFCVMIKETSGNYDSRAANDLLDKIAAKLKVENPNRYNQWINGVDFLKTDTYSKNTYIKVDYDSVKAVYKVTVSLCYTDKDYNQSVSYLLFNEKEYDAKALGYKPPAIYLYYNQFVQNGLILSGTDSITLDNSGLVSSGSVSDSDQLKCFIIKTKASLGEYTYYERLGEVDGGGNEVIYGYATQNTAGSCVYKVETEEGIYYKWPTYVLDESDYHTLQGDTTDASGNAVNGNKLDKLLGGVTSAHVDSEPDEDGNITRKYYYDNVMVPANLPGANPATIPEYKEMTSEGGYTYLCAKENVVAPDGTKLKVGDVVYQQAANEYVWPNGNVTTTAPSVDDFSLCTPSKMTFNNGAKLNLLTTDNSVFETDGGLDAMTFYTNLNIEDDAKNKTPAISFTFSTAGVSNVVSTGKENNASGTQTTVNYATVDLTKYVKTFNDNYKNGDKKLYHLKLQLYRITKDADGNDEERKILTLESGKEA